MDSCPPTTGDYAWAAAADAASAAKRNAQTLAELAQQLLDLREAYERDLDAVIERIERLESSVALQARAGRKPRGW